jgi:hypothetical protein
MTRQRQEARERVPEEHRPEWEREFARLREETPGVPRWYSSEVLNVLNNSYVRLYI